MSDDRQGSGDQQKEDLIVQLTRALKESRSGTDKQLETVSSQLNSIVPKIEQLQRDVLIMQADMKTQYVHRAEYEPRQQMILEKIQQYDKIIIDSQQGRDRFVRMEEQVINLKRADEDNATEIKELDKRFRGLGGRVVPIIAAILSALALISQFIGHISIR